MPKSSSKKTERPVEELTYEEALAELEEIVSALEGEPHRIRLRRRSSSSSGDKLSRRVVPYCSKRLNSK